MVDKILNYVSNSVYEVLYWYY